MELVVENWVGARWRVPIGRDVRLFWWVRWEASDGEREWVARLMGVEEWFWDRRNGYIFSVS